MLRFVTFVQPLMPANTVLPSVDEVDVFSAFQPVLAHMQMLWELVLTAEPLVVMAASPTVCAQVVQSLIRCVLGLLTQIRAGPRHALSTCLTCSM